MVVSMTKLQLLLSITDKLKDAALEATVGRSLESDARLHAISTCVVQMCTHMGLAINPKQPPAGVQGPPWETKSVTDSGAPGPKISATGPHYMEIESRRTP